MKHFFVYAFFVVMSGIMLWTSPWNVHARISFLTSIPEQQAILRSALHHYRFASVRRKSARFLIGHLSAHKTYDHFAVDRFRAAVCAVADTLDISRQGSLDSLWNLVNPNVSELQLSNTADRISESFLLAHIESAIDHWMSSAWKDSISWRIFKQYVLPVQSDHEPLYNYQDTLRAFYAPLIAGVNSPFEAYRIIYQDIVGHFTLTTKPLPHDYEDPLVLHRLMTGTCNDRTLYIVAVMRALCIPVAYDFCQRYANYSFNLSHSWAPFIAGEHVLYTMLDNDTAVFRNSIYTNFSYQYPFDTTASPFTIDSVKKIAKVWRKTYVARGSGSKGIVPELNQPLCCDVSAEYGMNATMWFRPTSAKAPFYLATFLTKQGWKPTALAKRYGAWIQVKHFNTSVCYLLQGTGKDGRLQAVSSPFIVDSDMGIRWLEPDTMHPQTVILRRKYPLISSFMKPWSFAIGSTFDVSDVQDFSDPSCTERLYTIEQLPVGPTHVQVHALRPYRYVRFRSSRKQLRMAEIAFWGKDEGGAEKELTGRIIFDSIPEQNALNLFDKDFSTETRVDRVVSTTPYWVGLDLGESNTACVSRIDFCTYTGTNFIEPGDLYELLFFDKNQDWVSLGKRRALTDTMIFHHVPANALLWLRDLTKGKEERVFTYEHGKQVWW